jgi:hypothetical protein
MRDSDTLNGNQSSPPQSWPFFAVYILFVICLAIFYWNIQPQTQINQGKGFDGLFYSQMFETLTGKQALDPVWPFCKRIALPWIAAQLPLEGVRGFYLVNQLSALAAAALVYLSLNRRFSPMVAFLAAMPMAFHLWSPLRSTNFMPFLTDGPPVAFYALAAFLMTLRKPVEATLVFLLSSFFRETGFVLAAVTALFAVVGSNRWKQSLLIIGVAWIATFGVSRFVVPRGLCWGSQLQVVVEWSTIHLGDPHNLLRVLAALSLTLAPFLYRALTSERPSPAAAAPTDLSRADVWAFVMLALALVMTVAGGSDMTRIMFLSYPLYVGVLATQFRGLHPIAGAGLAGLWLSANWAFAAIKDPVTLKVPNEDTTGMFGMAPDFGNISVGIGILVFWMIGFILLRLAERLLERIGLVPRT